MPETRFEMMGAGSLRKVSLEDLQRAIGEALTKATGEELAVSVTSLDFSQTMGAKMSLAIGPAKMFGDET